MTFLTLFNIPFKETDEETEEKIEKAAEFLAATAINDILEDRTKPASTELSPASKDPKVNVCLVLFVCLVFVPIL